MKALSMRRKEIQTSEEATYLIQNKNYWLETEQSLVARWEIEQAGKKTSSRSRVKRRSERFREKVSSHLTRGKIPIEGAMQVSQQRCWVIMKQHTVDSGELRDRAFPHDGFPGGYRRMQDTERSRECLNMGGEISG